MDADEILRLRLANQRITQALDDPAPVVVTLGAVQSQDYAAARWALGLRLANAHDASIQRAFDDGRILRTHVLRPTWHFVAPQDIRWLLALTGPRVKATTATRTRALGLDAALVRRTETIIESALGGGKSLTRAELGAALSSGGVTLPDHATLAHLVGQAELDAIICSGPLRGHQHTYSLLEERVAPAPIPRGDDALVELTWRYFSSHGPALAEDCAWWSGLTLGDVRRGLQLNTHRLQTETFDGRTYWFEARAARASANSVFLLPNFDEYTVAYRQRDLYYDRARNWTGNERLDVPFRDVIVANGRVAGRWQRSHTIEWTIEPSAEEQELLEQQLQRYAKFQGASVTESTQPSRPSLPRMRVHSPLLSNAVTVAPSS